PKKTHRLPTILSQEEVAQLIDAAPTTFYRTIFMTLYATGVRNAELTRLKVSDIDSRRMVIHIQGGKGREDRDVMLYSRNSARTGDGCKKNPASGYSPTTPATAAITPSTQNRHVMPASTPPAVPESRRRCIPTCSVTALPRTCWKPVPTCTP